MNMFVLDLDFETCARYHVDKHQKMILEHAQMLSTACRLSGLDVGYKPTHINHPVTKWCRKSLSNWKWMRNLTKALDEEFKYRRQRTKSHKSYGEVVKYLPEPKIEDIGLTPFALAMPDIYKTKNAVESYRKYYINDKQHIAKWTLREKPEWYREI